ncbi:hypothetical protein J6X15_04475 [Candidatus Saccharibacteria bacterium]|nr:hypothetical protein [Candidatus Saccharibacteria bacterium]
MPKQSLKQRFLSPIKSVAAHPNRDARRKAVERDLINAESALGRSLFGEVKAGHTREFFCLKKNVWLWYEDGLMIRYEVRENGVYKQVGNNSKYQRVSGEELQNFRNATKAYLRLIKTRIYNH